MAWRAITLVVTCVFALGACGSNGETTGEAGTIVYAVGDAADGSPRAAELASYIKKQDPDRFFYLGDVYESGTAAEFDRNYDSLYGDLADRTDPVIGNHEYSNRENGYYPFWEGKRGWTEERAKHRSYVDPQSGWQVIAYSSETDPASEARWVRRQIDKQDGTCRIALAHRARYSIADSQHTDNVDQAPIWKVLAGRTAINLAAHSHVYGRLAPIDGVTVIVSGQGGHDIRALGSQQHRVEASAEGEPTVTRFMLRLGEAEMTQMGTDGKTYDHTAIGCTPPNEKP